MCRLTNTAPKGFGGECILLFCWFSDFSVEVEGGFGMGVTVCGILSQVHIPPGS